MVRMRCYAWLSMLVVASTTWLLLLFPSPSYSLRCNVCSNMKSRRNDTCGDRGMWDRVDGRNPRDDR